MACAAVLAWLMALSAFDIRQRRLPNWLTLPGALAILILASVVGRGLVAVTGALALFEPVQVFGERAMPGLAQAP